MKSELSKAVLQKLSNGGAFFFMFSKFLLRLDCKDFTLGVMYQSLMQVLALIAALLPIKILLFLAPNRPVPEVVADFFHNKEEFVIFLCVCMFIFMCLAYWFSKLVTKIAEKKVRKIVAKSKEDNIKIKEVTSIVNTCMLVCSSSVLFILFVGFELVVYRDLVYILLVVLLVSFTVLLAEKNGKLSVFQAKVVPPYKLFSGIARFLFIGSFLFIVYDVLVNEVNRSFIELIVGLVLIRQSSMLVASVCSSLVKLDKPLNLMFKLGVPK